MARARDWKSEYQVEYIRHHPKSHGFRRQTRVMATHRTPPPPPSIGTIIRTPRSDPDAPIPGEDLRDRSHSEYTAEYVNHGPGLNADLLKPIDHDDMFTWRKKRTVRPTTASNHSSNTSIYNPAYAQTRDYHYERDDPDLTKFRRLEAVVDVNPFKAKHRIDPGKQDSSYRTAFRNFYPEKLDPQYRMSSTESARSRAFLEGQREESVDPLKGQIHPNPFHIESRKLKGVEEDINSIYKKDFVDPGNPPLRKGERRRRNEETLPNWETYRPDKPRVTDLNPFDFAVRGKVPSNMSTISRDNYVDFFQREPIRRLDE
jgi:hypothetical protein